MEHIKLSNGVEMPLLGYGDPQFVKYLIENYG